MHYLSGKFDIIGGMWLVNIMKKIVWESVEQNMVRHVPTGSLYLRAKVGGKPIRKALGVSSVRPGKIIRDRMLAELRAAAGNFRAEYVTCHEALALTRAWYEARPLSEQKKSSLLYRRQILKVLAETLPQTSPRQWTHSTVESWWLSPAIMRYSATRRNGMLDTVRKMFDLLIEKGARANDPSARIKRGRVINKPPSVPGRGDLEAVIEDIAKQNSDYAVESSNMVAFLAYSGCRIGEARHVQWEDINDESITITGGESGTKNREIRHVPIIQPMRELLDQMRYEGAAGNVFTINSPRFAITNACERCNINPFTPHTLRHLFATVCIESGVDIPTVARWLGHKDGGALAMRVYGHLRDEHSQAQAERVKF